MPPERAYGPTEPAPRCEAHDGLHPVWQGQCVVLGRLVVRPYSFQAGRCETCGLSIDLRRDNRTGQVETLDEGSDRRHVHAAALVVQLDETVLASALAGAFDEVRRRRERPSARQQDEGPVPPALPSQAPARNGLGSIPRLDQ